MKPHKAKSLHAQIREDIETRIVTGQLMPGDQLPFEVELMQQYGCARMTVNKAMSGLVADGLVVRRKRAGSFVAHPKLEQNVMETMDIPEYARRLGKSYRFRRLSRTEEFLDNAAAKEMGVRPRREVVRVTGLHIIGGQSLAHEARVIFLDAVPEARDALFESEAPGKWLLDHVPWSSAENEISATLAGPEIAELFDIQPDAPCLVLLRSTWRDGVQVTFVRQTFPADRYRFKGRFTPGSDR